MPENIGERLSIDETKLGDDVYTILSNKAGHGGSGTLIAVVKGTGLDTVASVINKVSEAYSLICSVISIFRNEDLTKDMAKERLREWYDEVAACTLREIKSARDCIKSKEDEVLNYFDYRSTNASAESLNSKIKGFKAQLHGVSDIPFFMFRLCMIFG